MQKRLFRLKFSGIIESLPSHTEARPSLFRFRAETSCNAHVMRWRILARTPVVLIERTHLGIPANGIWLG